MPKWAEFGASAIHPGVVTVTKQGKQRVYNLEPEKLKTVHDWVVTFEALWSHQLDRIKERAERAHKLSRQNPSHPPKGSS